MTVVGPRQHVSVALIGLECGAWPPAGVHFTIAVVGYVPPSSNRMTTPAPCRPHTSPLPA